MWRFLVNMFAIIGLILVIGMAAVGGLVYAHLTSQPAPPDRFVLRLDLRQGLPLGPSDGGLAELLDPSTDGLDLRQAVSAIDRASGDPRVAGLVVTLGGDSFGLGTAQELRAAVTRFARTGRPTLAFSDGLGQFGSGTYATYLASAFDEVVLSPVGMVGLNGLHIEQPYFGEALADLGVEVQVVRREDYKTFADFLSEPAMPEEEREMLGRLLDDLLDQVVAGIAEGRGLTPEAVRAAIDRGLLTPTEALAAGLVDRLAAEPRSGSTWTHGLPGVGLAAYRGFPDLVRVRDDAATAIAVITIDGPIVDGEGRDPIPGIGTTVGGDTIVRAIETAITRRDIRGILLRIESGGGSATASLAIADAVDRARAAGVPVVAAIGSTGASGAYWIAARADRIVAQPGALTGSIGVVTLQVGLDALLDRLGIRVEGVGRGANSDIFTIGNRWDEIQRARIDAQIDEIYRRFVAAVAERRGLPVSTVLDLAGGRVWTGREAAALGLIDALGGYDTAAAALHAELLLPRGAPLVPVVLPEPRSPLRTLMETVGLDLITVRVEAGPRLPDGLSRLVGPLMMPPSAWTLAMPPLLQR